MASFLDTNIDKLIINGNIKLGSKEILDVIYPVGSIYTTTDSSITKCPITVGTWVLIGDKFLLPATVAGKSGGYSNKILPNHRHYVIIGWSGNHIHSYPHVHKAYFKTRGEDYWSNGESTQYLYAAGSPWGSNTGLANLTMFLNDYSSNHSGESTDPDHKHTLTVGDIKSASGDIVSPSNTKNIPPFYSVHSWIRTE